MNVYRYATAYYNAVLRLAQDENQYLAISLDPESKVALLTQIQPLWTPKGKGDMKGNVFADHVTIAAEPSEEDWGQFGEGERIPIQVLGTVHDDQAQAAIVALPEFIANMITSQDRMPHITISTKAGVSPAYSNQLVSSAGQSFEPINLQLSGHVKFLKRK